MALGIKPVVKTASFTLNRNTHQDTWVKCDAAAGMTVTLPAASGTGDRYKLIVGTTVTSNNFIVQVANSTDVLYGAIHLTTDIAGTSMPTGSTDDTITMNGSTKGGVKGSWVILEDIATGIWALSGALICTGTEATPFSAAV